MIELFYMGGTLFMSLVSLSFLAMLIMAVRTGLFIYQGKPSEAVFIEAGYVKSLGLFTLVLGALGQLIGLYSAFAAIEQMGSVAPALLAGGLKVSSITTIYGMVCYALSLLIYFGLCAMVRKAAD